MWEEKEKGHSKNEKRKSVPCEKSKQRVQRNPIIGREREKVLERNVREEERKRTVAQREEREGHLLSKKRENSHSLIHNAIS